MARRKWPFVAAGLFVLIVVLLVGAVLVSQVGNQRRLDGQKVLAASILRAFCVVNLNGVSDTTCTTWANETLNVNAALSDPVLACDRIRWTDRRDEVFIECLARAGVYVPD